MIKRYKCYKCTVKNTHGYQIVRYNFNSDKIQRYKFTVTNSVVQNEPLQICVVTKSSVTITTGLLSVTKHHRYRYINPRYIFRDTKWP